MPYATRDDLVDRFGEDELGQRESMLPPGATERALADASADVDGYLAARYSVPVAPVPETLVRLTCDLARYYLLGDTASEDARGRYKDALAALRDISLGSRRLGLDQLAAGRESATVELLASPRVFGRSVS